MQFRPMSAIYRYLPLGERSALWAPWRRPPKSMTEPSSFWVVVSMKERVWVGWTGMVEVDSLGEEGYVKAPVEGERA